MNRSKKNESAADDRDIITISLSRDELMIALNPFFSKKQKNRTIRFMQYKKSIKR